MVTVVSDTVELEEVVGEMSNPISFSNSLRLKSARQRGGGMLGRRSRGRHRRQRRRQRGRGKFSAAKVPIFGTL